MYSQLQIAPAPPLTDVFAKAYLFLEDPDWWDTELVGNVLTIHCFRKEDRDAFHRLLGGTPL